MPITFINGFVAAKYRRYGELFSQEGAPEGGSSVATPVDYDDIPYAMGYYHSDSLRVMNTGFGRTRFVMKTAAPVSQAVISFHIKFGVFSYDYNMGESCFFVLRNGYSEGDTSNAGRGLRSCEIACRKDTEEPTKGSIEIWSSTSTSQQSNYTGSAVAGSVLKVIETGVWYFCEIVFNYGLTSVYFDNVLVAQGNVPTGYFDSHGIEWESFGFRGIKVSDYVFQEGEDAARLITPVRITNLFPARDKVSQGSSTGITHYGAVNEARVLSASSYITVEDGMQELFGMERGYPLGAPLAVNASVILSGSASGMKALYRKSDDGAILEGPAMVDTFNRSISGNALSNLFYAGATSTRDPNGDLWEDGDWVATWQSGFQGGSAKIHQFIIERLHVNGAGSGARYVSF